MEWSGSPLYEPVGSSQVQKGWGLLSYSIQVVDVFLNDECCSSDCRRNTYGLSAQGNLDLCWKALKPGSFFNKKCHLTYLGPDYLEARRLTKRCLESSCVLQRTRPRAGPESWCAGRDGTKTQLCLPCRCWRDVSRSESAVVERQAESRLGLRWLCELASHPHWISWTWKEYKQR